MNRRLFIGQTVAGFALHLLPVALTAAPFQSLLSIPQGASDQQLSTVAAALQQGLLGTVEQLTITHTYSPELTTLSSLQDLVKQDFEQAGYLVGIPLSADMQLLFADSPSAAFGSFAASFTINDIAVTWQGMARVGTLPSPPTGALRLFGSAGFLDMNTSTLACQLLDLNGKYLQPETSRSTIL